MFIGHYAVALAAKRWAPGTSLATTFLAVQFLDVLWAPAILLVATLLALQTVTRNQEVRS